MPCYYAGSLNGIGVTVNECARDSELKSRSANNTRSMLFVSVVHDYGRRLNQSPFRPRAEVSFPRARQVSEYNGKEASASRVKGSYTMPANKTIKSLELHYTTIQVLVIVLSLWHYWFNRMIFKNGHFFLFSISDTVSVLISLSVAVAT